MLHAALAITLALLAPTVRGQGDLSAANNVTDLEGTWSSNAAVSTGGVSISAQDLPPFNHGEAGGWMKRVAARELARSPRPLWPLHRCQPIVASGSSFICHVQTPS